MSASKVFKECMDEFNKAFIAKKDLAVSTFMTEISMKAHDTGRMMNSVTATKKSEDTYEISTNTALYSDFAYASVANDGRGPVEPKGNYPLHWKDYMGRDIYARKARGFKGRKFKESTIRSLK